MGSHYRKLAITLLINFVLMYFITYALINTVANFYFNINRVYIALMMVAPMGILMLVVMRSMFKNTRLNSGLTFIQTRPARIGLNYPGGGYAF